MLSIVGEENGGASDEIFIPGKGLGARGGGREGVWLVDEAMGIEKGNTSFVEGSLIKRWGETRSEIRALGNVSTTVGKIRIRRILPFQNGGLDSSQFIDFGFPNTL